eukprot:5822063-Prorocentrum_lima.AAC.1
MVADPLTKGKTLRHVLNIVLQNGEWVVQYEVKKWSHRAPPTVALFVQAGLNEPLSSNSGPHLVSAIIRSSQPSGTVFQ